MMTMTIISLGRNFPDARCTDHSINPLSNNNHIYNHHKSACASCKFNKTNSLLELLLTSRNGNVQKKIKHGQNLVNFLPKFPWLWLSLNPFLVLGFWHRHSSVLECVSTTLVETFHLFTFSFSFHLLYLPPTAPPLCLSLDANSIFI